MKHLIIILFLGCLITSYCSAQVIIPDHQRPHIDPPPQEFKVAVTFIPNDTCNLKINGIDRVKIVKNSPQTIWLPLGNYRLFFESLETGETINKRSFRLNRDSITGGKYTYQVTFKQQN